MIAVLGWACGGDTLPTTEAGETALPAPVGEWRVSESPIGAVGLRSGAADFEFTHIAAAARLPDGGLVVADAGGQSVRTYGPDGARGRLLGGPGDGPGEFRAPTQLLVGADGAVRVWDAGTLRITDFDAAGELVSTEGLRWETLGEGIEPPLYPGAVHIAPGDVRIVRLLEKLVVEKGEASVLATQGGRPQSGAIRRGPDGTVDTLEFFPDLEVVEVDSPWGPLAIVPPLAHRPVIAIQPNGPRICVGDQTAPAITCHEASGDRTELGWGGLPDPIAPTSHEIDRWRDSTMADYVPKLSPDAATQLLNLVPIPESRPPHADLTIDLEGNVWVDRGPVSSSADAPREHLVFDLEGRFVARVELPPMRVLEIGADYVIGVVRDALDVQSLVTYALEKETY